MKRAHAFAVLAVGALGFFASIPPAQGRLPLLGDIDRARRARGAILEIELGEAENLLKDADLNDAALAVERARLFIYEGRCDAAASLLARPDLSATAEGAELGDIARGCARATAATVLVRDEENGVVVRLQDDADRALVPLLANTAVLVRENLAQELGVLLPKPLWIDLVRDQFTLAAMTGLPLEAAQTTGTVAVAKWGRVTMISPRATGDGYPWLDTLAHEMTHLALSRGTRDKAPLWLQEGVAKRQETRWRSPVVLDDVPSADAVAAVGLSKGLGRPLDKLGPSIAMLPSAEEASVAFAEVTSFIRYWAGEVGPKALPDLVVRMKQADDPAELQRAIAEVSGLDLPEWDKRWRAYLNTVSQNLPPDLMPGAHIPNLKEVSRRVRLGQLLEGRSHFRQAAVQHARAHSLMPAESSVRCYLAAALLAQQDQANAAPLVEQAADIHNRTGRWFSLNGFLHPGTDSGAQSFGIGISFDPLSPPVACEEKLPPLLPTDPIRSALCEAARNKPVPND